jgi:rhodanese-related sulfurtransferase
MTHKSAADLFAEAKQRITEVTPQDVRDMQARGEEFVLLDVREPNEWNLGHLPNAIHIPRGILESGVEARVPRDQRVVIYCASGNRSALAAETLQQMGYTSASSMSGGFRGWAESGGAVED